MTIISTGRHNNSTSIDTSGPVGPTVSQEVEVASDHEYCLQLISQSLSQRIILPSSLQIYYMAHFLHVQSPMNQVSFDGLMR